MFERLFLTATAAAAVLCTPVTAWSAEPTASDLRQPDAVQSRLQRLADAYKSNPKRFHDALERAERGQWKAATNVAPESTIQGRWLIFKKFTPLELGYRETYVNFTSLVGPLGYVQTDLTEVGFSVDNLIPMDVPTIAFKMKNDVLGCNPIYLGFKPAEPANQVVGLMICTDGSKAVGDWSGCNNPVYEDPWWGYGAYCPGLPVCSYTDPNCL